ncbi:hypothetical protein ACJMK2_028639 [Sinanodonta woodiana]|uniref:Uncharacterized protein n=1 Tax=Sinanodonta woodiana TaxID=1069815 RepID=A0ABD3XB98_SINWO
MAYRDGPTTVVQQQTRLRRPKVSFKLDNMAKEKEALPIVELKPFVRQVWRREKSLPSFYGKSDSGKSRGSSETDSGVDSSSTPSQQSPSPRLLNLYVDEMQDLNSKDVHTTGDGIRPKSRIHPAAESKIQKHSQYSEGFIPGLLSRADRRRTTFLEINMGENTSRSHSCLKQALNPADIQKQQAMHVRGERMSQHIDRKQLPYLNPYKSVYIHTTWHSGPRQVSPPGHLYSTKSILSRRENRPKTPFYDILDRSGTLPSLCISPESLYDRQSKLSRDGTITDSSIYKQHTVGGIQNSLKLLSKHGTPTKVEKHLTLELEFNLSRFRKSRDYFPFDIIQNDMITYSPHPSHGLTQGELHIRQGLLSNTSKKRKNIHSKGVVIKSEYKDCSPPNLYTDKKGKGKQRKTEFKDYVEEIELDSSSRTEADSGDHGVFVNEDDESGTVTPPMNTARSEAQIVDNQVDTNIDEKTNTTSAIDVIISSSEDEDEEELEREEEELNDNAGEKNNFEKLLQTIEVPSDSRNTDGRTFLTSDPVTWPYDDKTVR